MLGKNNGEGFMDRRNMIGLGLAAAAMPKFALADTVMPGDGSIPSDPKEIVTLWPGTPPGGAGVHLPNRIQNRDPGVAPVDRYIDQVGNPSMIVFRPVKPDGSAIIVAPGGGYSREMMDFEGTDVARRFNAAGVTVFVAIKTSQHSAASRALWRRRSASQARARSG